MDPPPRPGTLTQDLPVDGLPFAVVDVETTGFSPKLHDRIVEIAIVRITADGSLLDEFGTLVNPGRDLGPTDIHGISAEEVLDAPTFEEIAGDVVQRLEGAVFVAHNVRFDLDFVGSELSRAGVFLPGVPALCSLKLAYRMHPGLANHQLATCCAAVGFDHVRAHSALDDAKAVAALMSVYLATAREWRWTLADLGCAPLHFPASLWPRMAASGRICLRRPKGAPGPPPFLARLVASLGFVAGGERLGPYLDLLDRVLEDRRITDDEGEALAAIAMEWGLTAEELLAAHQSYVGSVIEAALADGIVSDSERKDLDAVAHMLAVSPGLVDAMIERATTHLRLVTTKSTTPMAGLSVCFTGKLMGTIEGVPITREVAHARAEQAGLKIRERVTKDLDLLVMADPYSQSGKATKARSYGTRVMAEAAFWQAIGAQVG